MNSALTTAVPASAETAKIANTGFRLGEDQHASDASDSDQSATSERSISPSKKRTKSKKKRERKRIGALTHELDSLLGSAFSAPNGDASATGGVSVEQASGDVVMETDPVPAGKKMNKRTRQNLAKMEARKQKSGNNRAKFEELVTRTQAAAAERRGMTLDEYREKRKHGGGKEMTKSSARRARKEEQRAKRLATEGDKMEIG
ncbi:uncharacterized protein K460DRAFT_119262 [Cucurbitaria berberidis CBS 394.84]|uniref:Uncharacterized protein n=1 Tax=Cucurbitaria berberidis CBS 394.84 TaxID=1168544 RepID=A0A9P4L956_9PLEO|nr:uncharacterized protein K460DRAFT_119262 [Cucurbitaria berberidis CBS 394.84]KAF1846037.1 hypothetical protein K460DRAFT_119262 [Cucurbitaria berberidis CBS 394.84]